MRPTGAAETREVDARQLLRSRGKARVLRRESCILMRGSWCLRMLNGDVNAMLVMMIWNSYRTFFSLYAFLQSKF